MWLESGAPYAGSYAGLRNGRQQERAGAAAGSVFGGAGREVLQRRCASCHEVGEIKRNERPLPFNYELRLHKERNLAGHPTGSYERIVTEHDPLARYSDDLLVDFTHPEHSALLLGPLAKPAGGWASCSAEVFRDRNDPDFVALQAVIAKGQAMFEEPRYGMPGFRPNPQYLREMKKYGILPESFDAAKDPLDIFETDRRYWESAWYRPEGR